MLMKERKLFQLCCGTALLVASAGVSAQADAEDGALLELEEIVVTGTTTKRRTKIETSVAITTADRGAMDRKVPAGTGDVLELVPGLWVEDSGGETAANVAVRGVVGQDQFRFVGVQEDGLPVIYSGELADQILRQDITIERLEAVRGGTSGVLTTNGPAALVNFITRRGTDEPEGDFRLTVSDYGTLRPEFFYGGPLTDDWKIGIGGYWRTSNGVRNPGFTADRGGQVRVNLTRDLDNGVLNLSYKKLDENNIFYLPIPLQDQDDPRGIPGFDPNYDTLVSNGMAGIGLRTPEGMRDFDLQDGFVTNADFFGLSFDYDFNDSLSIHNKMRYSDIYINGVAALNFSNAGLQLARDYITNNSSALLAAEELAGRGAVDTRLRYAATGEIIADPGSINGNGLVTTGLTLIQPRIFEEFIYDVRIAHQGDRNAFAVGVLYAASHVSRGVDLASFLTDVRGQPNLIDLVAIDAAGNVVGSQGENGILHPNIFGNNGSGDMDSISVYVNDEFQVTDNIRIDGGLRYETVDMDWSNEKFAVQPLPGTENDGITGNNMGNFGTGVFVPGDASFDELAWTAGFNYTFSDSLAIFGRYADNFEIPRFGKGPESGNAGQTTSITSYELGVRYYLGDTLGLSAVLFRTEFDDFAFRIPVPVAEDVLIETISNGVEIEGVWQPMEDLLVSIAGIFQDATFEGIPERAERANASHNGNQITRTPNIQFNASSSYTLGDFEIFGTVAHFGKRYSDMANDVKLPPYTTVDAGLRYDVSDNINLQVKGSNLTNALGLQEGNPREGDFSETSASGLFYARPILGRNFTFVATYSF